ncbi:hypothetical protein [Kibdelosporangium aridum]|uniref:Uncharacterized protein n=1 Tax=Kibdelosporangium aridum TaxID=2030 RepID=A0A1Y5XSR2_KIBAR|nr:hypothetical protein [Kibdelosporangium aridum]SMD14550.1 hypothetical protein SAMN05661093_05066 [Kibdelosporangium aridum]
MAKHELDGRVYGSRYHGTRTTTDLADLAERIITELPSAGAENIPVGTEFSIHVMVGVLLHVYVGGLSDEFTFSDRTSGRHSEQATELGNALTRIVESYGWTNPSDPTDRRFVCSVYLLAESDFRSSFWTPGVVRVA